jgi:hypothetical protein
MVQAIQGRIDQAPRVQHRQVPAATAAMTEAPVRRPATVRIAGTIDQTLRKRFLVVVRSGFVLNSSF